MDTGGRQPHEGTAYDLLIGEQSAETVKMARSAAPSRSRKSMTMEVRGLDKPRRACPKKVVVTSEEIREAISEPVGEIIESVQRHAARLPARTRRET